MTKFQIRIPKKFRIPNFSIGHWALVIISSLVIGHCSFAEVYLRDVPEGHFAYDAVYDLIKRGIVGGYPDGTFRGKKLVSRYELASFLSKLVKSFSRKRGADEKLTEELKSEVSLLLYQLQKARREAQVTGNLQACWRVGRTPTLRGGKTDYRLVVGVTRNFSDAASLKINLDTMDLGFGGVGRDLVREIVDVEGKVRLGAVVLKITSGPGDVAHIPDPLFPAEANLKYPRLRRTVSLSNDFGSLEYLVRTSNASGATDTCEVSGKMFLRIRGLRATLNPRLFFDAGGRRDTRLETKVEWGGAALLLGVAKSTDYPHGLYVRGDVSAWDGAVKIVAQKIGAQYRQSFFYNIFDIFDRGLSDGCLNFGLELTTPPLKSWYLKIKGDYTNPGEIVTTRVGLGYVLNEKTSLELIYQTYRAVEFSETLGLNAKIEF